MIPAVLPCNLPCRAKRRLPLGLIRMRCAPTAFRIVVRVPGISPICASDERGRHAASARGPVRRGRCKTPDAHPDDSPLTDPTRADCLTLLIRVRPWERLRPYTLLDAPGSGIGASRRYLCSAAACIQEPSLRSRALSSRDCPGSACRYPTQSIQSTQGFVLKPTSICWW